MQKDDLSPPVCDIAKFIIRVFQESEDPITNLKLQKLLYYVQGWHLALFDKPAFNEDFQAWVHSPVIPEVFQEYKIYRWNPIIDEVSEIELPQTLKSLIVDVLDVYGGDTGWSLEMRTHKEAPWLNARNGLSSDESSTALISKESIESFFKWLANDDEQ